MIADAFTTLSARLITQHVEITQEVLEDGSRSRVVSWPARQFIVSQDAPGGSWSVYDVEADEVLATGETSVEALRLATER